MIHGRIVALLPLLLIPLSCSTRAVLHPERQTQEPFIELCGSVAESVVFQGSGSVLFVTNGEKQSGSFDVRYGSRSSMAATFYSPMGTVIGSISVGGDSGVVTLQGQSFRLPLAMPLDSVPLSWAGSITFGTLVTALTGKVAYPFSPENLAEKPQTTRRHREFIVENKMVGHTVVTSNDLKKLRRIVVSVAAGASPEKSISIVYESFFNAMARYITIKADDRNYFSLRYDNVQMAR